MRRHILLAVGLAFGLLFLVLAGMTFPRLEVQGQGSCDRYVLGIDASDSSDCSDETSPCRTVQYAIDQAAPGDVICVARHALAGPLVYSETLEIVKSITLDGAWDGMCVGPPDLTCSFSSIACDPGNVTIHAEGAGRVISISGSIAPIIDCLTIAGGDAAGQGGDPGSTVDNDAGGGIYSRDAAPVIVNSVITANYGCETCTSAYGRGGGIYLFNASATAVISNNLIANNVADETTWGQGGGVMLRDSDAQVLNNTIAFNRAGHSAGDGGGVAVKGGQPLITDNTIRRNVAARAVAGSGAGIYVWSSTPATIERNLIESNWAITGTGAGSLVSKGGGIYYAGNPTVAAIIRDNTLRDNMASLLPSYTGYGGGMYLKGLISPAVVSGNVLEANVGSFNYDGNGGGIYADDSVVSITGNQLSGNSATWTGSIGEGGGLYLQGGTVLVQGNVISGNFGGGFPGFPSQTCGRGGGVMAVGGQTVIEDNTIQANGGTNSNCWGIGGGVCGDGGSLEVIGNTIVDNYASAHVSNSLGGGVALSGTQALVQNNHIVDNTASIFRWTTGGEWGAGGGIYATYGDVQITANVITGNLGAEVTHGFGGGMYLESTRTWLDRNWILDNRASAGGIGYGGAVRAVVGSVFTMTNNVVARNQASTTASGVGLAGSARGVLAHNTIGENTGGVADGVRVESSSQAVLTNNVIFTQTWGLYNAHPAGSTLVAAYTLFESNGSDYGAGVTSSDEVPGLASLTSDYHIPSGSNAIDQATPLSWVTRDIDGDPRPVGPAPDVGADEYALRVFLPLVIRGG